MPRCPGSDSKGLHCMFGTLWVPSTEDTAESSCLCPLVEEVLTAHVASWDLVFTTSKQIAKRMFIFLYLDFTYKQVEQTSCCSGAHALTDKLGLIRTYQGFLPGEYALQPIRDTLIVALWLVPYSIKPIYL